MVSPRRGYCRSEVVLTNFAFVPVRLPAPNRVTSWPRSTRPSMSAEQMTSRPPYPRGGSSYHGGATIAIFSVRLVLLIDPSTEPNPTMVLCLLGLHYLSVPGIHGCENQLPTLRS